MRIKFKQVLMALLLTTLGSAYAGPHGTITCNIGSTSVLYTTTYVTGGANSTALSVPIRCDQTNATANSTDSVTVTVNIGNSNSAPSTTQNTAKQANVPSINYDFYTGSGCTPETHGATNPPAAVTVTMSGRNGFGTGNALIYGCVPVPLPSAMGTYTDTVTTTIPVGGVVTGSGTPDVAIGASPNGVISVSITIPERCNITMPTGALVFTYTSFTTSASQASKTFSVTCGAGLTSPVPTMALTDVFGNPLTSGTAAGLAYTLALNTLGNSTGGASTLAVTSGGSAITYRINGNMVAGQVGSCGAPATSGATCTQTISGVHYLTVTW